VLSARRGERGNVALAVVVMVLMATLGATLVSRVQVDARAQRGLQSRDQALALAEVGAAAAQGRIGVGESASSFTLAGTTTTGQWTASATRAATARWEVTATGSSEGAGRAVEFAVVRDSTQRWVVREWRESAAPVRVVSGWVDEWGSLTLTAPAGATFTAVVFASYGTPSTAEPYTQSSCHAATSSAVVAAAFVGRSSATVAATNGVFGDPCYGTFKRLAVTLAY